jgi:hypothetical protein
LKLAPIRLELGVSFFVVCKRVGSSDYYEVDGARFVEDCRLVNISIKLVNILLTFFKIRAKPVKILVHMVKILVHLVKLIRQGIFPIFYMPSKTMISSLASSKPPNCVRFRYESTLNRCFFRYFLIKCNGRAIIDVLQMLLFPKNFYSFCRKMSL